MNDLELRFQKIYDEYHARIHGYLRRMVGEDQAEDLTQDVFVKIGHALENFRGESKLSTWIYRIATNTALDHLRSVLRGDNKKLSVDDISDTEADKNVWTGEDGNLTDKRVIRREMNHCIREVIETLPESYKLVLVLSDVEGMRDNEISEIIGSSLQATKIKIHRARARLRSELEKTCVFYRDEENEFACERKDSTAWKD